jgi:hypothetical protein
MSDVLMTSIVLKRGVTLMDIVSSRMLGQFGFLATVFDIFRSNQISVDVVATSEISISLTLDPGCDPALFFCCSGVVCRQGMQQNDGHGVRLSLCVCVCVCVYVRVCVCGCARAGAHNAHCQA